MLKIAREQPVVIDILHRSKVARIATLSHNGRPSVNTLSFIYLNGKIWLSTAEWTLAARNVKTDPRVSMLFEVEQNPGDHRVLRIRGRAIVWVDQATQCSYNPQAARKYILSPGSILNWLTFPRLFWLRRYDTAQSAQKGQACVIEVKPEQVNLLINS